MSSNGGKAVNGVIEALKSQPLLLALVIMNLALLALFYVIVRSAEGRQQVFAEQQRELMQLLAHCNTGSR